MENREGSQGVNNSPQKSMAYSNWEGVASLSDLSNSQQNSEAASSLDVTAQCPSAQHSQATQSPYKLNLGKVSKISADIDDPENFSAGSSERPPSPRRIKLKPQPFFHELSDNVPGGIAQALFLPVIPKRTTQQVLENYFPKVEAELTTSASMSPPLPLDLSIRAAGPTTSVPRSPSGDIFSTGQSAEPLVTHISSPVPRIGSFISPERDIYPLSHPSDENLMSDPMIVSEELPASPFVNYQSFPVVESSSALLTRGRPSYSVLSATSASETNTGPGRNALKRILIHVVSCVWAPSHVRFEAQTRLNKLMKGKISQMKGNKFCSYCRTGNTDRTGMKRAHGNDDNDEPSEKRPRSDAGYSDSDLYPFPF
jgi:hypothetical protein